MDAGTTVLVDRDIAEAVLQTLTDAYPRQFQPSEGTRELFIGRLVGLDAAALLHVVEQWIDENRFPPSVAELRQPTLAEARRVALMAWVEEAREMRPRRGDVPDVHETVACGLRVDEVLTEAKRHLAHTFFGQVTFAGFDPVGRTMRVRHPQPLALDWWHDGAVRARILDTLKSVADEPIGVEFV